MSRNIWIGIVVVVVLVAGGWWYLNQSSTSAISETTQLQTNGSTQAERKDEVVTVRYCDLVLSDDRTNTILYLLRKGVNNNKIDSEIVVDLSRLDHVTWTSLGAKPVDQTFVDPVSGNPVRSDNVSVREWVSQLPTKKSALSDDGTCPTPSRYELYGQFDGPTVIRASRIIYYSE